MTNQLDSNAKLDASGPSGAASRNAAVGAESGHSIVGRWKAVCRAYWRHRQFGWWALWQLGTPIKHINRLLSGFVDTLIYPKLRTMELDRPVFVIGHPRSGTTFLQRLLHETGDVAMFRMWELYFPTLSLRRLARPIVGLMRQIGHRTIKGVETGHPLLLDELEDDEGLFVHVIDSEAMALACPWLYIDADLVELGLSLGSISRTVRRTSCKFYSEALRRQVIYTRKSRIVSKSPPSSGRVVELLELFPNARFIHMIRRPEDAIRSFLSMHRVWHGKTLSPDQLAVYMRNRYRWSVNLYRSFEQIKECVPQDRLLNVRFDELTSNTSETMRKVIQFAQLETRDGYWHDFDSLAERAHRPGHRNAPLESSGISPDEVRRDLKSVYEEYNLR